MGRVGSMTAATALAFDIGGTTSRCALVSDGKVSGRISRRTVGGWTLADDLAEMGSQVAAAAGSSLDQSMPVGVSVPGPLSPDRRSVAFTGNVALRDYPLADLLESKLGRRIVIDDDANCAALAEARSGAARGTATSVTLVAGTGVGSGIVLKGILFRGAHSLAGEVGHVRVAPDGRTCSCGRRGCLEAMANGAALVDRAGPRFSTAEEVIRAAMVGDDAALAAVRETATYLAVGVVAIASMLDPDCIVLAGGIGRQPVILQEVIAAARGLCVDPLGDTLDIRAAELADDSGLIGAAALLLAEKA